MYISSYFASLAPPRQRVLLGQQMIGEGDFQEKWHDCAQRRLYRPSKFGFWLGSGMGVEEKTCVGAYPSDGWLHRDSLVGVAGHPPSRLTR